MKIRIKKKLLLLYLSEVLCGLLVWLSFWQFVSSDGEMVLLTVRVGISVYLWMYILFILRTNKKEITLLGCISMYVILLSLTGRGSYQVVLIYLPIAFYLLKKRHMNKTIWTVIPLMLSLFTLYAWINSPNNFILFPGMSRNYVSVFLIFSLSIYYLRLEKEGKECPLFLVVSVWLGAISALGRGGILSSSVLLILFFIRWIIRKKGGKSFAVLARWVFIALALIMFSVWVYNNLEYIEVTYFGRFFGVETSANSSSAYRLYMYKTYISACFDSIPMLIFGTNASRFTEAVSNLHNSYLQIHSSFGLIGVIFVVVGVVKLFRYLIREKRIDLLFIMCGVLIRAGTDWCFPGFPMDIILLYGILMPFVERIGESQTK